MDIVELKASAAAEAQDSAPARRAAARAVRNQPKQHQGPSTAPKHKGKGSGKGRAAGKQPTTDTAASPEERMAQDEAEGSEAAAAAQQDSQGYFEVSPCFIVCSRRCQLQRLPELWSRACSLTHAKGSQSDCCLHCWRIHLAHAL